MCWVERSRKRLLVNIACDSEGQAAAAAATHSPPAFGSAAVLIGFGQGGRDGAGRWQTEAPSWGWGTLFMQYGTGLAYFIGAAMPIKSNICNICIHLFASDKAFSLKEETCAKKVTEILPISRRHTNTPC